MKKKLLRNLLLTGLTLLSVGVFTSCSDDDNSDKNETKNKTLLSRIEREGFAIAYEYDAQNRLIKITETELEDESSDIMNISYDNQGRISEFKRSFAHANDTNDVLTYTYSKDTIFEANSYNSRIDTLYVNSNNQLLKARVSAMTTLEYEYDADGDLVKAIERYIPNTSDLLESTNTTVYSYSTKKGGLLDANIPSWFKVTHLDSDFILSTKSCTEIVNEYVVKKNGIEELTDIDKETCSYIYDKSGKPVEVTLKDDDSEDKYTLTYIER